MSRLGLSSVVELADRHDLVREPALVRRGDRALVGAQRPGVLVLARDPELARDERRLLDHVPAVEARDQPVVGHQIEQRAVAEPVAEPRLLEDVGRVRHRLHAARHDDAVVAGADHQVGDLDGPHAGGADLVDRVGGHLDRQSRPDRSLPRGRLAGAALEHLAHDHVLDLVVAHIDAVERRADRDRAELGRLLVGETAAELAERRPDGGDDHGTGHGPNVSPRLGMTAPPSRATLHAMASSPRTWAWSRRRERGGSLG